MRKKQARPARRITSGPPEAGGLAGTSQEVLSSIWHSPSSSSTRIRNTPSTGKPDDSAGSPFCVSALQDAALVYHNNTPPLKAPKYESDDFERSCCAGECASFSRSQFAHYGSVNGNNSRFPTDCSVPIVTSVSGDQKPFPCQFTANGDSPQSSFDVSTSFDRNISSTDSESPLKCLERCVRTKSREEGSTFGLYRNIKPSASTKYDFRQSRRNTNSMQFRFGYDSTKTSAADALGELSQLVHRIGAAKLPVPAVPNKFVPNSITSNIFTCLKCAQRFDTLDELVLHISTTKHFTRGATKNLDAVAPWERDRAAANFEKEMTSANFLAPLFYGQKCLEVEQKLSQRSMDGSC